MRTGTASDRTIWIWCATCGAYTSERYRSLGLQCAGRRNTGQRRRLEGGCHPILDVPIGMEPRDMTWNDVDAVKLLEACMMMADDNSLSHLDGEDDRARRLYADCEHAATRGHSLDDDVCTGGGLSPASTLGTMRSISPLGHMPLAGSPYRLVLVGVTPYGV